MVCHLWDVQEAAAAQTIRNAKVANAESPSCRAAHARNANFTHGHYNIMMHY